MTVVFVMCLLAVALASVVWSTLRHRRVAAWDRELNAAFAPEELRELPRHRVL